MLEKTDKINKSNFLLTVKTKGNMAFFLLALYFVLINSQNLTSLMRYLFTTKRQKRALLLSCFDSENS